MRGHVVALENILTKMVEEDDPIEIQERIAARLSQSLDDLDAEIAYQKTLTTQDHPDILEP